MAVMVPLAVTRSKAEQPANILLGIVVMEAGSSIDSREVHSLKVEPSVIAMPSGSVISVSADAPEKVPVPESFCRLLGRWMVVKFLQPDTTDPEAISSTPSSKVRVLNCFMYCRVALKTLTLPGMVISVTFLKPDNEPPMSVRVSGSTSAV